MRLKRYFAALLAVSMVFGIAGCSSSDSKAGIEDTAKDTADSAAADTTAATAADPNAWDGKMPVSKEKINLKIAAKQASYVSDWNTLPVFEEMEKRSNVHIDWQMVPEQSSSEKFNIMLASGDLPDAFISPDFTMAQVISNGDNGVFVKMNDLIEKDAPNIKALLEKDEAVKQSITTPDGSIYSLPKALDDFDSLGPDKMWFNDNWMKALNAEIPTTIDDLYNLMVRMKTEDPNGNGLADEVPLSNIAKNIDKLVATFGGSFGIVNRGCQVGVYNSKVDYDEAAKKVRYIPSADGYKEMMKFFVKLYKEGLLDQELFTMDKTKLLGKGNENLVGIFLQPNTFFETPTMTLTAASAPMKGPNGDQIFSPIQSTCENQMAMVITATNKYPEETMRWVDYFYGYEGAELHLMGIKDKTYYIDDKGVAKYKDEYTSPFPQSLGETTSWMAIAWPGLKTAKFGGGLNTYGEKAVAANAKLKDYIPEEIWPSFTFTAEESERLTQLESDLKSYITDMQAQWLTGKSDIDSSWDSYIKTLKDMGSEEVTDIYQAAYDRYKK